MQQLITIDSITISQDAEGRYSLNDLHRAAGGESRHQPANWLRLDQIKALVEEIDRSSEMRNAISVMRGGLNQGTFVRKELVYSYAMWVSPKFHLHVIRTFDAVVNKAPELSCVNDVFKPLFEVGQLLGLDSNAAAIAANQATQALSGQNVLELMGQTHLLATNQQNLFLTPTEIGVELEISGRAVNLLLLAHGLQEKSGTAWKPTEKAEGLYRLFDTGKKHGGVPVTQMKWSDSVIEMLKKEKVA